MQININKEDLFKYLPKNRYLNQLPDFSERKTQAFTTLILSFIAFSIFGVFAISPTLSTIAQLKKQLSDNQYVDQQLTQKITNLNSLQQQYNLLTNDLPLVKEAIPQTPQIPLLTGQIQAMAANTNVTLGYLQMSQVELTKELLSKITSPQSFSAFTFSLQIQGSYNDISSFLSSFVNFQRIITIDTYSVTQGSGNTMRLTLRGNAYFRN